LLGAVSEDKSVSYSFIVAKRSTGIKQDGVVMNKTKIVRKTTFILACMLGITYILGACSSDSDDSAQIIADEFVSITGTINNLSDTAEPGVAIEGVYGNPGDVLNPVTVSNSNTPDNFSLEVFSNTAFFLHATKDTFATINTARTALNADITADAVEIPTVDQAQTMIDKAFGVGIVDVRDVAFAWLVVDAVDVNDNEVIGKTISIPPTFRPLGEVYTVCDGTASTVSETTGPCPVGRQGPMYIAYFDIEGEVDITVGGQKQTAPIRKGEIAVLEFEVAANEYFIISGKVTGLTGTPMEGVDVEAVYTVPGGAFNPVTVTDTNGDYFLQVLKNEEAFLKLSKAGFASVNTLKLVLNTDLSVDDISLPTVIEAEATINTAFASPLPLVGHAWLMVDVVDISGAERDGETILSSPVPATDEVYTDCDGSDSTGAATTLCGPGIRVGPMYIAYFDSPAEATISVNNVTQTAPLRVGEITYLVFKPDPPGP
jgi:hypothetical protein